MPGLKANIDAWLSRNASLSLSDKVFFTENLRVMARAGVSLSDALRTLARQSESKRATGVIEAVRADIEAGRTLASGLARFPRAFPPLFVSMVRVGEMAGTLEGSLGELADQMKKEYALRSKVRGAMMYPAVVFTAMIGITTGLVAFVLPKLLGIFKEFKDVRLPLATRLLIAVSDFIQAHGIAVAVAIVAVIAALIGFDRTVVGRALYHKLALKLPILGPIVRKVNLARFSRVLAGLLKTDIPVVQAFEVTADVLGNVHFQQACRAAAELVRRGATVSDALAAHEDLFPPLTVQMASVGERTGAIDELLAEVAAFYESQVTEVLNNFSSIIEPVLILLLGAMVGGIALAVLTPMYALTEAVANS